MHTELTEMLDQGLSPQEVQGVLSVVRSMRRNQNLLLRTEDIEGPERFSEYRLTEGWTYHNLVEEKNLTKEHEAGEMELPKEMYRRPITSKSTKTQMTQTLPAATMTKGSQTRREEMMGVEMMDLESADSTMGELPAMLPPGVWAREAQLRWIAESETKSMSLSGVSSVASIASERDESPEPPPLILEGLEEVSPEEEPERPGLVDPCGLERRFSPGRHVTREVTPTRTTPVERTREIKIVTEEKQQVVQRLEITLPGDQEREVRTTTRANKRSAGERSPPPATTPTKSQTTAEQPKPPPASLFEKAYRKQKKFYVGEPRSESHLQRGPEEDEDRLPTQSCVYGTPKARGTIHPGEGCDRGQRHSIVGSADEQKDESEPGG